MSDQVTVVVFKDNDAARTFRVPLRWLSQMGFFIGLCLLIALGASFLAFRYYRTVSKLSPAHVEELEQELQDARLALQTANQSLQQSGQQSTQDNPAPAPTTTVTVTSGAAGLFAAIPGENATSPARDTLPFTLSSPTSQWRGNTLTFKSAIQYTRTDGGNQQGHIVILARGPELILAYPKEVFNLGDAQFLIQPKRGEYFSVSRYREIRAEFGPVRSQDAIKEIELMIFGTDEKLLIREHLKVEKPVTYKAPVVAAPPAAAAPAPSPAVPTQSTDEIIAPGADR